MPILLLLNTKAINRTPISFLMVDLDLKDFGGRGGVGQQEYALKKALNKALGKIKKERKEGEGEVGSTGGNPTVLWTGNGYHIY
jgi:hypothetical protein